MQGYDYGKAHFLPPAALLQARRGAKGETLEKVIDTGFYWYDTSNMADPKIATGLYD